MGGSTDIEALKPYIKVYLTRSFCEAIPAIGVAFTSTFVRCYLAMRPSCSYLFLFLFSGCTLYIGYPRVLLLPSFFFSKPSSCRLLSFPRLVPSCLEVSVALLLSPCSQCSHLVSLSGLLVQASILFCCILALSRTCTSDPDPSSQWCQCFICLTDGANAFTDCWLCEAPPSEI